MSGTWQASNYTGTGLEFQSRCLMIGGYSILRGGRR